MKKNERGVTLVILATVIIVMLILITTSVYTAYNKDGLMKSAEKEQYITKLLEVTKEIEMVLNEKKQNGTYNGYDLNYMNEELKQIVPNIDEEMLNVIEVKYGEVFYATYNTTAEKLEWAKEAGMKILESYQGEPAYIPEGFTKINYEPIDMFKGIVITDAENGAKGGNEYVWVPVFGEINRNKTELAPADDKYHTKEECKDEADEFRASVNKYNGFYVARYEAGIPTETASTFNIADYNFDAVPESKSGLIPWMNVTYKFAREKSKEVMSNSNDGVKSDLMNSYAWDTIMQWLQANKFNTITNSGNWGNRADSVFSFSGKYGKIQGTTFVEDSYSWNNTRPDGQPVVISTGKSETTKANNIYDLSGNVCEWTTEYLRDDSSKHIFRGGDALTNGTIAADSRWESNDKYFLGGFRVILYKKANENKTDGSWDGSVYSPKIDATGLIPVYHNGSDWIELNDKSLDQEWAQWYDYSRKNWANAKTADGSMWVWIPRFEYKIDNDNKAIKVNFVQIGDTTTDGYILHPAFKDGTVNGFENGEWDKELPGFWVAKYEAGYQNSKSSEKNNPVDYSGLVYTEIYSYSSNFLEANLTKDVSQISYPVFKPGAYSYNVISVGDAFLLSQEIDSSSMYGLSNVDSHLIKNSEWGAVAYLTHSQYGLDANNTNNNEVTINKKNFNNSIYVNNASSGTKANVYAMTGYAEQYYLDDPRASSTQNMSGVFDLNGGLWERVASYRKGGNADFSTWHSAMADSSMTKSTKYVTLYLSDSDYKIGDATDETVGWNSDNNENLTSSRPVFVRGGCYSNGVGAGIFSNNANNTSPNIAYGFRVCLAF